MFIVCVYTFCDTQNFSIIYARLISCLVKVLSLLFCCFFLKKLQIELILDCPGSEAASDLPSRKRCYMQVHIITELPIVSVYLQWFVVIR